MYDHEKPRRDAPEDVAELAAAQAARAEQLAIETDETAEDGSVEVPAKFVNPETGEIRLDMLVKSYLFLERQMSARMPVPDVDDDDVAKARFRAAIGVPEGPDGYTFDIDRIGFDPDPEVTERLHTAGMTQDQAQMVYELAGEHLSPMVEMAAAEFETERQEGRLVDHFGGKDRWQEAARQMRAWGKKRLHPETMNALSCTHEGCLALHKMMEADAPSIFQGEAQGEQITLDGLRTLMRDPRYWRDNDPQVVEQVSSGFRRLYDE